MKKNSLSTTGLSMSEAQSISNLCNQRALDIENSLKSVKTATKTIKIGEETHTIEKKVALPDNVTALLLEKGKLHGCQAFLMENIQAKERLLNNIKSSKADISFIEEPEYPNLDSFRPLPQVNEDWGWEQLTVLEMNEFYESEALAAHIGKFIHKGSKLETLRNELANLPSIEWMTIKDGEKTPVKIVANHSTEYLQNLHEELSKLHKTHEARTNYFKAKVKNLVTIENGRISKLNADKQLEINNSNKELMTEYNDAMRVYSNEVTKIQNAYEIAKETKIKEAAVLKIKVDPRFQSVVDIFIK